MNFGCSNFALCDPGLLLFLPVDFARLGSHFLCSISGETGITLGVALTGGGFGGALPITLSTYSAGAFSFSVVHAAAAVDEDIETDKAILVGVLGILEVASGGGDFNGICDDTFTV